MRSTDNRTTDTQDADLCITSDSEQILRSPFIAQFKTPQRSQSRKIVTEKRIAAIDLNHRSTTVIRRNSGKMKATDNQNNTRHVPRRLTQVVAPSPVRRTDASARSRWKRSRSVRVARGRSGPRPPAAPAGPRQTHSSHAVAGGGGGEVHPPAATPGP
jgi:hypothetical protein